MFHLIWLLGGSFVGLMSLGLLCLIWLAGWMVCFVSFGLVWVVYVVSLRLSRRVLFRLFGLMCLFALFWFTCLVSLGMFDSFGFVCFDLNCA